MSTLSTLLSVNNLTYQYEDESVISFPDFTCSTKDEMLISGNSGTGKTTLIYLICGLLKMQKGEINFLGESIGDMSSKKMDDFRGKHIGLVFQSARFIASLDVLDNVLAGQYFGQGNVDNEKAMETLESLGISALAKKKPQQLSGGERQRLSIARAVAGSPDLVIADEPTSSLDDENAEAVYELLNTEAKKHNSALIIVTHDDRLKRKISNQVRL